MAAAIALVGLAGCAAEENAPGHGERVAGDAVDRDALAPFVRDDAAPVVVTRDDLSIPAGCRPGPLARRIAAFFDAFNRGDPAAATFVEPSIVVWSMGMPPGRRYEAFELCPQPRRPSRAILACARRS